MTGNAGYLGMPTQSMKATVIDGSANSRGPWASVAGQTVTITALNAAPLCSVAPDSTSSHGVSS